MRTRPKTVGEIAPGMRVTILAVEGEGALREGPLRVKLPTGGTVVDARGANGYTTYLVYVDALKATRRFSLTRLEPMNIVQLLGDAGASW